MEPSDGFKVSWPILIGVLLTSGLFFIRSFLEECEKPDPPDWLFGGTSERSKEPKKKKRGKDPPILTAKKLVEDAVMFLCCLGEKRRKVDSIVKDLSTKKKYEKMEDLVKDFYKHS